MARSAWFRTPRRLGLAALSGRTFHQRRGLLSPSLHFELSFIPLISSATPDTRVKLLCEMADSFVYVISRMGVTGAAHQQAEGLSSLMDRVRRWSGDLPTAVGFGVSTREHFLAVQDIAKDCVIGSQISVVGRAPTGRAAEHAEEYLAGSRSGKFGGQYVSESLLKCLAKLEAGFKEAQQDPTFWDKYRAQYAYIGRPSSLHLATRLTEHVGKTRIIAETGAGQHGVATAALCAKFGLKCTIYLSAEDTRRQALNVFRMKLLGAEVVPVESGSHTTHYVLGSVAGPHPFPTIVRTFQTVIGDETKQQLHQAIGMIPDAVVACICGGSNASGMFYPFIKERVQLLGDQEGQITPTHSISAGMDYPGVGPDLSSWKDGQRARFVAATNAESLMGFRALAEYEGILPGLESSHAVYGAIELAKTMAKGEKVVVSLSGRGDKDVQGIADHLSRLGPEIGWDLRF
ncbi:tryptophan synthase beta subunit-like PLP-dependent enzyme [Aspergillus aurantiobrunneus]